MQAMTSSTHGHNSALKWSLLAGFCAVLVCGCGSFNSQARNTEGVRLFQQGQYHQALRQFQEASYADPENPDGYYNLAATYHRLGISEGQRTYLDQAENYYNQCLDRNENHVACYRGLTVLLAEQGRTEEAFRLLEGWVARQPGVADAKVELARLSEEYGNSRVAKEHLRDALDNDPNNTRALAALGRIREQMGETAQALQNYQRVLAQDPGQYQVASRVSALRGQLGLPSPVSTTGASGTRLVDRNNTVPLR